MKIIQEIRMLVVLWLLEVIELIHPDNKEYRFWMESQHEYHSKCLYYFEKKS